MFKSGFSHLNQCQSWTLSPKPIASRWQTLETLILSIGDPQAKRVRMFKQSLLPPKFFQRKAPLGVSRTTYFGISNRRSQGVESRRQAKMLDCCRRPRESSQGSAKTGTFTLFFWVGVHRLTLVQLTLKLAPRTQTRVPSHQRTWNLTGGFWRTLFLGGRVV